MPLALIRTSTAAATDDVPPIRETDLDRILKLIPTEVLACYAAALPVLPVSASPYARAVLFLVGLTMVPVALYLDGRGTGQPARWGQYAARMVSFAAWAGAIAWPFGPWLPGNDHRWIASLAVLIAPLAGALLLRDQTVPLPER